MSTEQDDAETAMGALYGELLRAFREAKENGKLADFSIHLSHCIPGSWMSKRNCH
jgi:hypothetical protein